MKIITHAIYILIMQSFLITAFADETIVVSDAWVRAGPPTAKVLAAYMKIMNKSDEPRKLTAVSSGSFNKVEMHKTDIHEGMMKMVPQKYLEIPAGGSLKLEPGGYHLMLMNLKSVPQEGEQIDMELHFDNGQTLHISVPVRTISMHERYRH